MNTKSALPTPCLLLDRRRMRANVTRMRERLAGFDVPLRPHLKTCKSIHAATEVVGGGDAGIAVSTLAEADAFHSAGFGDLLYAVGLAPGRMDECARRIADGMPLIVVVDAVETARLLGECGRRNGIVFRALIEIDVDGARAGLSPDAALLPDVADALDEGGCEVAGVMTHAGASYGCGDADGLRAMAETERRGAVAAAERLRAAGHDAPIVSVGSTPTALFGERFDGVTEVRAGVHVFMDLVMANLGVCALDDIALSVLCEVIGRRGGERIVDAGWTALSADRGTAKQAVDYGYGQICDERGAPLEGLVVRSTSQEHGIVARRDGSPIPDDALPIGTRLRVLPNHACATAQQHAGYHVLDADDPSSAVARWPRITGW
ncbi:MAG: alanine racemase [Wenzhouxiangellaceae bacterium]|nr:alanine racemase [Wenzhouxiangellaceae bacterium]